MSKQKSVQFKKSTSMGCQIIFQYFETFYRAYHHIETFYSDDTREFTLLSRFIVSQKR